MSNDRASASKADILVIDDRADNLYRLSAMLVGKGYQVRTGANLEMALGSMETQLPDLILLDLEMPGTNGYEACQLLKTAPGTREIPIIFLIDFDAQLDKKKVFEVGAADYLAYPYEFDEAIARLDTQLALVRLKQELAEHKVQLQHAQQQIQQLSDLDGLTQLANRRQFDKHLTLEWRRLKRDRQPLSLIFCDLDYFKHYNDTYGPQAGDRCLQSIAKTLSNTVKRPADLVARYGPEEFGIILPNTNLEGAVQVAELIRLEVKRLKISHSQGEVSKYVTLSLGISSQVPVPDLSPGVLIAAADEALCEAKEQGRDRCCISLVRSS